MSRWVAAKVSCCCLLLWASGCLEPAHERALLDQRPIQAQNDALSVRVNQGAAVIRQLTATSLHLFAQTPQLQITVQVEQEALPHWELALDNALPGATLIADPPLDLEETSDAGAMAKRWRVSLPAGQTVHLTVGCPDCAEKEAFRFAVLSDIQDAVDRVDDLLERINQDPQIRFVLSTGDLTESGQRSQYRRFRQELASLSVPWYSTIGNHDVGFSGDCIWHEEFGRHSFHFDFKGVAFSFLDTASATLDPLVYDWLDDWLDRDQGRTHVVVAHIPLLDPIGVRNGAFRSRREAAKLLGRLAQGDVDLTLYGHIHSYYSFSNAGIPAYISGGGGAIPETMDGIGRHFLTVDLSPAGIEQVAVVRVD